jgi:hypothetical protein
VTSRVGVGSTRADLGDDANAKADAIIARILAENGATSAATQATVRK